MCSYKYKTKSFISCLTYMHLFHQHFLIVEPVLHDEDAKSGRTDHRYYGEASSIKCRVCVCLCVYAYVCVHAFMCV